MSCWVTPVGSLGSGPQNARDRVAAEFCCRGSTIWSGVSLHYDDRARDTSRSRSPLSGERCLNIKCGRCGSRDHLQLELAAERDTERTRRFEVKQEDAAADSLRSCRIIDRQLEASGSGVSLAKSWSTRGTESTAALQSTYRPVSPVVPGFSQQS